MNLYFDIETIPLSEEKTKELYTEDVITHYEETKDFHPEFNMIYCISIVAEYYKDGNKFLKTKTLSSKGDLEKEKQIIQGFFDIINKTKNLNLVGYNIKGFDIPFIIKRAIHHGLQIPTILSFYYKKPREIDYITDLYEIYKQIGMGKSGVNLEALCLFLGITSPKNGGINGSKVAEYVAGGKGKEVEEYCEADAKACYEIYMRFKELNVV